MPKQLIFELLFAPEVVGHLRAIERKVHNLILVAIDEQLTFTPEKETHNRKLLEQPAPFGATWELRFGPTNRYRVFYEVDNRKKTVQILAIGVKEKNRLFIGREEFGK
jgi:mRNA-degrading endonuclease RelE of RelBE toxin-antitoxin system